MRKILLTAVFFCTSVMAGDSWSAELEYFPWPRVHTGEVYYGIRSPHFRFPMEFGTSHNDMAWRLGGQYQAGRCVYGAKYLFTRGVMRSRSLRDGSHFYHSSTVSAGIGGWLWRLYFQGRLLARHSGYRSSYHWNEREGEQLVWSVERANLDALGGGVGGLVHLRVWRGLGAGLEIDLLGNYLWADVKTRGELVEGEPLSYRREQGGADAQLYVEYLYKGKKRGGRLRFGSYAEGFTYGSLRVGEWRALGESDEGIWFGGLFVDLRLDF